MQAYKTVVTHFFACKVEVWISCFLNDVFGVKETMYNYEFAKSRGAIHVHLLAYTHGLSYSKLDAILAAGALDINDLMDELDKFIADELAMRQQAEPSKSQSNPCTDPDVPIKKRLDLRKNFLCSTVAGKAAWEDFEKQLENHKAEIGTAVTNIMEHQFAVSAMHIGMAPAEWVRPGSREHLGCVGCWSKSDASC